MTAPRATSFVGHTAAWHVRHLDHDAFERLAGFLGRRPRYERAIRRHQLEMALRKTSAPGHRLILVGHDVVDALPGVDPDHYPVLARTGDDWTLPASAPHGAPHGYRPLIEALQEKLRRERATVHSTVVARLVLRHVRGTLKAFPIRHFGGVYFVAQPLEGGLFALRDYLRAQNVGEVTHFRVADGGTEVEVLRGEIEGAIAGKLRTLRASFDAGSSPGTAERKRLAARVQKLRRELLEMRALFAFAGDVIEVQDRSVRDLFADLTMQRPYRTDPAAALDPKHGLFDGPAGGDGTPERVTADGVPTP